MYLQLLLSLSELVAVVSLPMNRNVITIVPNDSSKYSVSELISENNGYYATIHK